MPFSFSNASVSIQGYINKILTEKLDIFVIIYLDNILIYTEDPGQPHVEAVRWVLEQLQKNGFFANRKKCRFHLDEFGFLGFVISAQGIMMEEERIEAVKTWLEPQSIRDIQVFLGFANFYRRFIKNFNRIAAPLTSMLRTTPSTPPSTSGSKEAVNLTSNRVESGGVCGVGGAGGACSVGGKIKNLSKAKNSNGAFGKYFLTSEARFAFTRLRKAFT